MASQCRGTRRCRLGSQLPIHVDQIPGLESVNRMSTVKWLFAEGAEGFFNTYVLLANPGATSAFVNLVFLRESAGPLSTNVNVPPMSRVTVAGLIAQLAGASFSIVVDSTEPIVAERAMCFRYGAGLERPTRIGGCDRARDTLVAGGRRPGPFFETYILIGTPG
jgi:hypothetical protein